MLLTTRSRWKVSGWFTSELLGKRGKGQGAKGKGQGAKGKERRAKGKRAKGKEQRAKGKEQRALNYFNYFTEIEDTFIRRRGKHLLMSPIDWALIESWKEMKVPLHVVLRGIDRAFDSWGSKPRKRTIKSLLYCQEEVEAQFAEWLESRVGAETEENGQRESTSEELERPFSRATIVDHLERARTALLHSCDVRRRIAADDLSDALERTADLLADLKEDYASAASPDAQKLEESLTGLERLLNQAMRSVAPAERLERLNQEVLEQLKPYRTHMDQTVYQQTFENLLLKRLREQLNIPRLSLFYL